MTLLINISLCNIAVLFINISSRERKCIFNWMIIIFTYTVGAAAETHRINILISQLHPFNSFLAKTRHILSRRTMH